MTPAIMPLRLLTIPAALLTSVGLSLVAEAASPVPLTAAHAHNDYEHPRPLLDALDHGFCSVEADIHLVDNRLLVAHDRPDTGPDRTLERLYLDPLRSRARLHGGRVFPNGPPFTLLIDLKTDADPTYRALRPVLERYADILTRFSSNRIITNAVTVILSGNRPLDLLARESGRLAAIDGRLSDLPRNPPVDLLPLISDHWQQHFSWRGDGPLPDDQRAKLREIVRTAHQQGRRLRFWAIPDTQAAWRELIQAGVDLVNTDHLEALSEFINGQARP